MMVIIWMAAGCRSQAAEPTQAVVDRATSAGVTPAAAASPAPHTPSSPALASCVNDAVFLSDLTVPDGTVVQPGQVLDKRWSVRNAGTCDWGPDYRLIAVPPNPFAGEAPLALYPARAGADAVWQVMVRVPGQKGEIVGRWQAQAPDGTTFGQQVFIKIEVANTTATPGSASTPSPQP